MNYETKDSGKVAVLFNLNAIAYLQWKLANNIKELFDSDESINNNNDWLLLYQNIDRYLRIKGVE